ncbi:hypothetical protein TIFTF001_042133 [Ficus carica]|uniref:Uncharacterized protein n=1 Tax=Ficus carica TaxID=3494 RepID=A0AA88A654_FICCA|nr:hypothetical protein TIFTF001_042133 [Ficus carica]
MVSEQCVSGDIECHGIKNSISFNAKGRYSLSLVSSVPEIPRIVMWGLEALDFIRIIIGPPPIVTNFPMAKEDFIIKL